MAAKFEVERFDGRGDFTLWKKKMRALLVQQKVSKALDDPSTHPATMTTLEKEEMLETAYSKIILYLADNVLRQVHEAKSALEVWSKLDALYLTKSLTNKLYLKERFFGYKMDVNKDLEQNLDEYNKITLDLNNIGETVSDENKAIILLNSLPESYNEVKSAIRCGRDSLTMDIVLNALRSRELEMRKMKSKESEALIAWGRTEKKTNNRSNSRGRSKSQGKQTKRCFHCHKEGHIRRNCYELKNKRKNEHKKEEEPHNVNVTEGYESAEVLTIAEIEITSDWILDSGCSFHMTPNKH